MFADDNGYVPTTEHLDFLGLTEQNLIDCESRTCPLGMTLRQFQSFQNSLKQALQRDNINNCDIRLKGSSAHFYSGYHKPMPWDRNGLVKNFRKLRERLPEEDELEEIESRIDGIWPTDQQRPERRPFDSMYCIGVDTDRSDYDIQISSSEIAERARQRIGSLKITVEDSTLVSEVYDFIQKDIIISICPALTQWSILQRDKLQRGVWIAAFDGEGPPNKEDDPKVGRLSSHFRPTDWRLS